MSSWTLDLKNDDKSGDTYLQLPDDMMREA